MIPATQTLIDLFKTMNPDSSIVSAYTNVICKYGGLADAVNLFDLFMEDPLDYNRVLLLQPIMKHGDQRLAQRIFDDCFYQGELLEDMPNEILHVLGYLGYESVTESLVLHMHSDNWHIAKYACLGLLHLPCNDHETQTKIKDLIESSYSKNLFQEFVPALSFKVSSSSIVRSLFEWGNTSASIDCNAGIILGIALFGSDQKDTIKGILWNPNWEAHGTATGTLMWSYVAMQHVELTFRELIQDVKMNQSEVFSRAELRYRLEVLAELLACKLSNHHQQQPIRFSINNNETTADIYLDLFGWSKDGHDDSVIGLISNNLEDEDELLNRYYHLRDRLEMKIEHQIELDHFTRNTGETSD
ncbi:hypothetical protein B1748_15045 [Paenibacillus sp. MY03]|uniref:hypothetical protein n=1 Tax=Paenibacillus sp. MY03 TaxID=302980 RepID=UPI000B3C6F66|nr:hypothetical protein [Paenibacillus sp. MY03]OUS75743.1 hypothetical protein B1748_15045 [Paenibacillus sp. MY03]